MLESGPRTAAMRNLETTAAIPREHWQEFLDDFSILNQDQTVRLELLREGVADTVLEDRPLLDITLDDGKGVPIIIVECGDTVGGTPNAFRHLIQNPTRVWAREVSPGKIDAVEIESRDEGTVALTVNPHPGRSAIDTRDIGRSGVHPPETSR